MVGDIIENCINRQSHVIYTIGYSGLEIDEFIDLLRSLGIELVIDVRRFPRSRIKGFTKDDLENRLREVNIEYQWIGELGALGIRYFSKINCHESPTFNSYVNYLIYDEKAHKAIIELLRLVQEKKSLILCREKNPRYCHRQFIADFLTCMGFIVIHVVDESFIQHEKTTCYNYIKEGCEKILSSYCSQK
ncbi:MAG: DUF488 family protein [Sulfolobales archaeon]